MSKMSDMYRLCVTSPDAPMARGGGNLFDKRGYKRGHKAGLLVNTIEALRYIDTNVDYLTLKSDQQTYRGYDGSCACYILSIGESNRPGALPKRVCVSTWSYARLVFQLKEASDADHQPDESPRHEAI